jgi:hypothetical protein
MPGKEGGLAHSVKVVLGVAKPIQPLGIGFEAHLICLRGRVVFGGKI